MIKVFRDLMLHQNMEVAIAGDGRVFSSKEASRHTYGIQPASADFAETELTVMRLKNGGELKYAPINLEGIAAIKLRYKTFKDATLSIFLEPYDELAKVDLSIEESTALPELPQAKVLDRLSVAGAEHLIESLNRTAYQRWKEITIPVHKIQNLDARNILSLKMEGNDDGILVELDSIEFFPHKQG